MARPFRAFLLAFSLLPRPALASPREPEEARRLIAAGAAKLAQGRQVAAIEAFTRATQADPDSSEAYFRLGDAYFRRAFRRGLPELADRADARAAVEAYDTAWSLDPPLRDTPNPFPYFHGMAQCYIALERFDDALVALKKAAALEPANPMPHLYAAQLRYRMDEPGLSSMNLLESAKRALRSRQVERLAELARKDALFNGLLKIPRNRAILRAYEEVQAGKLTEAQADARIRQVGRQPPATLLAFRAGNADLRDSLRDSPRDGELYRGLARSSRRFASLDRPEALDAAEADLSGRVTASQGGPVWLRIGTSYRRMGLIKEAERALERAVGEDPGNPDAHYQLALACAAQGRTDKALAALSWAFNTARGPGELRRALLMARTDPGLEPLRDLPRFERIIRLQTLGLAAERDAR